MMVLTVNERLLLAESSRWLTVNMHGISEYANVCFWPKADIRTESKSVLLNGCFGEKSGHSALRLGLIPADFT